MYATYECRKCGHLLRIEGHIEEVFAYFFEGLCKGKKNCPNCGEGGYENWIIRRFKVEDSDQQNFGHIDYELEKIK